MPRTVLLERTIHYFDVRVFNPHAPSKTQCSLSSCYRKHGSLKTRAYEQRIIEVKISFFTSLVLSRSAIGGMTKKLLCFTSVWPHVWLWSGTNLTPPLCVWYTLPFDLLPPPVIYSMHLGGLVKSRLLIRIRGARSSCGHAVKAPPPIDLVISELRYV